MVIESRERSTGRGARHFSAVVVPDEDCLRWVPLSDLADSVYNGREEGFEIYTLEAPEDKVWAEFHRSNSGKEQVCIFIGDALDREYTSFELADLALADVEI